MLALLQLHRVINNVIAYLGVPYIRGLVVLQSGIYNMSFELYI